jgi:mRNA interferase HicA
MPVNSDELLRKLKRLAKERDLYFGVRAERGKGGHVTVYMGDRFTILPQHGRRELSTGTFHAILKQLGLGRNDLEGI